MSQVRIAFIIDNIESDKAGTEKQLLETIRRLDRNQFHPVLICLSDSEWLRQNPVPCESHFLKYRGFLKFNFPSVIAELRRIFYKNKFDIIQTFFEDSIFLTYLASRRLNPRPVLLASKRDIGLGMDRPWYHVLFSMVRPYIIRQFNGVVANSKKVKEFMYKTNKVHPDRIKVIYNGINLNHVPKDSPPLFSTIKADLWIGIVANLHPVKRHDILVKGLGYLKKQCPDLNFQLVLLGEGHEKLKLQQLASKLGIEGRLHFEGSISDVSSYLQNLDIGVLCSDREGLSNAILEYMVWSLPVIATDVGGNPELVDEKNGICIRRGSSPAMGKALVKLATNPELRKSLGRVSYQKVEKMCSWDKTMNELQKHYIKLAGLL